MLTRLKVSGFKNLLSAEAEFGPFTCIVGANGVGKSNVFDVIDFLARLAGTSFGEAAQGVRGSNTNRGFDPRDIFWNGGQSPEPEISLLAEMLVPQDVEDDLGSPAQATTTFLRYELVLGYEAAEEGPGVGRIFLKHEQLTHITKGDAHKYLNFPHEAKSFRNAVVTGQRRGGPFLSSGIRDGQLIVNVHGDGGSYGRPQPRPVSKTSRTVLSTVTTNDHPTVVAARREMQSWKRVALEPTALRTPDEFGCAQTLGADGSNLAATLYRIAHTPDETGIVHPEIVYTQISNRLSDLLGSKVYTLHLVENGGIKLPARALSEGTLRFLALCVMLEDPESGGLICMEEPENGIHPANLKAMIRLVEDLAVDAFDEPGSENPFRQVIVNTHSPGVVQLCAKEDLLLARPKRREISNGERVTVLSLSGFDATWRVPRAEEFSYADLLPYLTRPEGFQLSLPIEGEC